MTQPSRNHELDIDPNTHLAYRWGGGIAVYYAILGAWIDSSFMYILQQNNRQCNHLGGRSYDQRS